MEKTMTELKHVFQTAQMRRQSLSEQVFGASADRQNADAERIATIVQLMGREPTTNELAFFASLPINWVETAIEKRLLQAPVCVCVCASMKCRCVYAVSNAYNGSREI